MEANVIKCPNCGANATNHMNCEYCGSLLVRFIDKGVDLSKTTYTDNSVVFPRLIEELEKNLDLQIKNRTECVATEVCWIDKKGHKDDIIIYGAEGEDGTRNDYQSIGLDICLDFSRSTNKESDYFDLEKDEQLSRFKKLDSYILFRSDCEMYDEDNYLSRDYDISFGSDAVGAARLISEILVKVKNLSPNDSYDIFTNVGDAIEESRADWEKAHGVYMDIDDDEFNQNKGNEQVVSHDEKESSSLWDRIVSIFK